MSRLDEAMQRLGAALTRLEAAFDERLASSGSGLAELETERDQLWQEVQELRAQANEDARLRAEAAAAVREALHDLRGAVGQDPAGRPGEEMHRNG